MKKWPDCFPACTQRLWFQLAVHYTLLAICAFTVLIMIMYGFNDYKDYNITFTLENVETQLLREKRIIAQAVQEKNQLEWQDIALGTVREKLLNLEEGRKSVEFYRITNSSRPEVFIELTDVAKDLLVSDPRTFPPGIAELFAARSAVHPSRPVAWLNEEGGPIWIDMPIEDIHGKTIGRLHVLYIAEFSWLIQLKSILKFLIAAFDWVIICSIPIGIACALAAARYVTRQLQKMNQVTESWRKGNFEERIELPKDDVLIQHSRHLNDMAQDLEIYFGLKQHLAVNDERNRVARELHDTVKQKLFALGLQLATAKAKPAVMDAAGEHIIEAETITREAQHDLMEIITQLRPTDEHEHSLHKRISMIAEDFQRRFDIQVTYDHTGTADFSAHIEHHVLRIVQESLMNAVRHGKASRITISSVTTHSGAILTIADNGLGFDSHKKSTGFGITSMRERAQDIPNGTLEIRSITGNGTQVILAWEQEA